MEAAGAAAVLVSTVVPVGTQGYEESVDYVVETMETAGWNVTTDGFPFVHSPLGVLEQLTPAAANYETGSFSATGFGEVTGPVIPVDLSIADPAASSSGCEAADFAGRDFSGPNDIAFVQRGTCFFAVTAVNAEAAGAGAGAEAIIIMNQGTVGRLGPISGNAAALPDGSPSNIGIPMVGAGFADGQALARPGRPHGQFSGDRRAPSTTDTWHPRRSDSSPPTTVATSPPTTGNRATA